jgi:hypothetical protein
MGCTARDGCATGGSNPHGPGVDGQGERREGPSVTGKARIAGISGKAKCGARRPDGWTPAWKHYRIFIPDCHFEEG